MTERKHDGAAKTRRMPQVPARVARNLIARYLDRNRDSFTAEFLEEAQEALAQAVILA